MKKKSDGSLDIAEVARLSGLPASTLRFYEEKGLISPVGRSGLRRLFHPHVLEKLALIGAGRAAGFSLNELASMCEGGGGRPRVEKERLKRKADELDRTIRRLTAMRDGLRHAANCSAQDPIECPRFRRIVRLANGSGPGPATGREPARRPTATRR